MKWKALAGVIIILCSIAGMYFWETRGRDKLLLCEITVASQNIREGECLSESMLKQIQTTPQSKVADSITYDNVTSYLGLPATHDISENQQLIPSDFSSPEQKTLGDNSIFVIPSSWIYSRTAAIRSGDEIELYSIYSRDCMGKYKIAYIRDSSEQPIVTEENPDITSRNNETALISDIEIICSKSEYFSIFDIVQAEGPGCILIVLCEDKENG